MMTRSKYEGGIARAKSEKLLIVQSLLNSFQVFL